MELLTFEKTVTVDQVQGWTGLTVDEWFKGMGVYQVEIGSRCEVESVVFYGQVTGLMINDIEKNRQDTIEAVAKDETLEDGEAEEILQSNEEFYCISVDKDGFVDVCLSDEYSYLYFKVAE